MAYSSWPSDGLGVDPTFWHVLPARVTVSLRPFLFVRSNSTARSSSRHLLGTGRGDEARRVIAELNGVPEDDALVIEVVKELDLAIKAENEGGKATWLECFSPRNAMWRRTMNGMMLQFIQQLNGQNFYCACLSPGYEPSYLNSVFSLLGRLLRRHVLRECRRWVSRATYACAHPHATHSVFHLILFRQSWGRFR